MQDLFAVQYCWLIPLLPLIGAMISGFFGAKWLKGQSHWPIWIGVGISAIMSLSLLFQMQGVQPDSTGLLAVSHHVYWWIEAGRFRADVGYYFDPLTAVMLCVVCGIGLIITIYAAGYMKGEAGYFRFFAYLGLFIFAMTNLVMGSNFLMLYLGWEGVGVCSYLLIGYYYERPAAREAAKKAMLVNRVGDFGFGLGIMLIFSAFGSIHYYTDAANGITGVLDMARHPTTAYQTWAMQWIPFLLMMGAFGKSAQFPLYVWLPDAMEGPTPVSALIHAATMVTAGVYMIARCGTLFVGNAAAMATVACIGAFTAIFAATIALRQFDLKKVFAYSTISQLGYMFVGVAVLSPVSAVFHLVTHAFFKALLFLSCGVVMHAMLGHLDMRKMSGLKKVLPKTNWLMLIGCLALSGFPFFSGFFSKDDIVGAAAHYNIGIWLVLCVTGFLTAYYTFRLYFRVFQGELMQPDTPLETPGHDDHGHDDHAPAQDDSHHAGEHHHNHEPALMIVPLVILAAGALLGGLFNFPSHSLGNFLGHSPSFQYSYELAKQTRDVSAEAYGQPEAEAGASELPAMVVGGLLAIGGIFLAYLLHLKNRAKSDALAASLQPLTGLLEAKYWVDEIYQTFIVEPLRTLGEIFFGIDRYIVDKLVDAAGVIPWLSGFLLRVTTERGYLQGYAATMLLGVAAILLLVFG
ncbi:MAG TPA: NADH-quinone oxidoreductase subunit L [Tepidisphaeraceae bacterium]|nr:NADH-quinone oxidoreductase subunit L [Tepidisphaeraceae bacterium]